KSGGGYIFISRILNPRLGFIATWLQFWAVAVSYGIIAVAVVEVIIRFGGRAGMSKEVIDVLRQPWVMFGIGAGVMFLFSGFACFGIKQTGRLLHTIFWIPAAILVVVYILFITATPETMTAGVQTAYGHDPLTYTRAALAIGMGGISGGLTYWSAVATAILAAYWAYIGYASATFVAGEVKEAHRTLPRALLISGIAICVLYMSISALMSRAGMMVGKTEDHSFLTAMAYLNYGEDAEGNEVDFEKAGRVLAEADLVKIGPPALGALDKVIGEAEKAGDAEQVKRMKALREKMAKAPPGEAPAEISVEKLAQMAWKGLPPIGGWMPFLADIPDIQATGVGIGWLMIVLVIFAALWVANDIPPFILTSSRMIFAMAFDGVLPRSLAKVNARWHSPVNAIIFVSLVSLLGAAAEAEIFGRTEDGGLWLGSGVHSIISSGGVLTSTDIWDAIFFTLCAVACVFFPIRKAGIFEKSPFRAGKGVVIGLGVVAALGNGVLLLVMAFGPDGWNLLGLKSLGDAGAFLFTVCLIAAGLLIYQYFSSSAKRTGVELTTVFTEIPPD
ncbi:MAG: APC family permease, partial [Planctomycetota bacterium]